MAAQVATQFKEVVLVEKLSAELERLTEWLEVHFRRREAHEAASSYVKALLSRAERKNTWGLSQEEGKEAPYAFQHLLLRASWDESTVRDDVLTYARQSLGEGGVLAVDDEVDPVFWTTPLFGFPADSTVGARHDAEKSEAV